MKTASTESAAESAKFPATASAAAPPPTALDHETRLHAGDHEALRLWLRLLTCTNLIDAAIRTRLRAEFDVTLPRFDLMAQLYRHPEGLKMGELSQRLMVTGGNVTGIAGQLENEGLVSRSAQAGDRRSFVLSLSAAGRRSFAKMAARHEQWVASLVSGLADHERHALHGLLARLKHTLRTGSVKTATVPALATVPEST